MIKVVAVSGAVASGKSTLARRLVERTAGLRLSTRDLVGRRTGADGVRGALQRAGDRLDRETAFEWVAEEAVRAAADFGGRVLVVDAVRRIEQVEALRRRFPGGVRHVHVTAPMAVLMSRHAARRHHVVEPEDHASVRLSATEQAVEGLAPLADVTIDTSASDVEVSSEIVLAGFLAPSAGRAGRPVDVLVGGQYGSEGKGNVCSFLASEYDVLMRVGGPNAGHLVRDPDFKFRLLPSGTLHNHAARLLVGAGAVLSLPILLREIEALGIGPDRLSVDPQAMIIEDWDVAWESGGGGLEAIGSTKAGVGAATARKILGRGDGAEPFGPPVRLARMVDELSAFVRPVHSELERAFAAGERVMLEGTQGTGLSIHHASWPYVTSRETTASGCLADAGIGPTRVRDVIMVVRTYPIRVGGTSGGMGCEIDAETVADRSGLDVGAIRATETGTVSGRPRRIAEYDEAAVVRAARLNGATRIAPTFADYVSRENVGATSYAALTPATRDFVSRLEYATGVPVEYVAKGPRPKDVLRRRVG